MQNTKHSDLCTCVHSMSHLHNCLRIMKSSDDSTRVQDSGGLKHKSSSFTGSGKSGKPSEKIAASKARPARPSNKLNPKTVDPVKNDSNVLQTLSPLPI